MYGFVSYQDLERTLQNIDRTLDRKNIPLKDIKVWDVATPQPVTVFPDEPIWAAIQKMAPRDLARLPVVSKQDPETMVGLISRSDILKAYQVGVMRKQQDQLVTEQMKFRSDRDVCFLEVVVEGDSSCVGKKLGELPLHQSTSIVSIKRNNTLVFPGSNAVFQKGDILTIFCRTRHQQEVRQLFSGELKVT